MEPCEICNECSGWTPKDCLALRIYTHAKACYDCYACAVFDPEFGLCALHGRCEWFWQETVGPISLPDMMTGLQLLVPLAEQQGDQKLELPPPNWRDSHWFWLILTLSNDSLGSCWFNGFQNGFKTVSLQFPVRWTPSFLRIFWLAATETTSRRVQGHLGLRRQDERHVLFFARVRVHVSSGVSLKKTWENLQSPMAYHHSTMKHC